MPAPKKTLILGLGNPILGDDGVGWRVAEAITDQLNHSTALQESIEVDCLAVGGLSLMERMIGYDRVILIDAITTAGFSPGDIQQLNLEELPDRAIGHLSSTHDTTLQNAIRVGKAMGAHLPAEIKIVAIEARNPFEFSEDLTPPIACAVPQAVSQVFQLLN
jgi:hydrogenase maturation protease